MLIHGHNVSLQKFSQDVTEGVQGPLQERCLPVPPSLLSQMGPHFPYIITAEEATTGHRLIRRALPACPCQGLNQRTQWVFMRATE